MINRRHLLKAQQMCLPRFRPSVLFPMMLAVPTSAGGEEGCLHLRCTSASLILSPQEQKELDAVTNRDFYMHCNGASLDLPGLGRRQPRKALDTLRATPRPLGSPNHRPRDPHREARPAALVGTNSARHACLHGGCLMTLATCPSWSLFAVLRVRSVQHGVRL